MYIRTMNGDFTACLQSQGTDIFLKTWTPSPQDLLSYPHITLCSSYPWNPQQIKLPAISAVEHQEIEWRNIIESIGVVIEDTERDRINSNTLFDINEIRRRIIASAKHSEVSISLTISARLTQ